MSIIEDVVHNAKTAASTVGKSAGALVDKSKLRLSANEIKGEINHRYEALGKAVYHASKNGQDISGLIDECVISIDALYGRLDEINDKLNTPAQEDSEIEQADSKPIEE